MNAFDTFTEFDKLSRHREWRELGRRAFVVRLCSHWTWLVTDLSGNVLGGRMDWDMDAFQAAERAVAFVESPAPATTPI